MRTMTCLPLALAAATMIGCFGRIDASHDAASESGTDGTEVTSRDIANEAVDDVVVVDDRGLDDGSHLDANDVTTGADANDTGADVIDGDTDGSRSCATSADCGATDVCASGLCQPCGPTAACATGETCTAGRCVAACSSTLQSLVDAASAGATVVVPACLYRERVTIVRAITLAARPGAEIRGSDVWSSWTASSGRWTSSTTLPMFFVYGTCEPGTSQCQWPEQVFVDGHPLAQVASNPAAGEFAMDSSRHVVLGADPAGHTVEITTRAQWIRIQADDVTLGGFRMQHAANPPQGENAALVVDHVSRATIHDNVLSDAHGTVVGASGGTGHHIVDNDISRGGQNGFGLHQVVDALFARNHVHDNNTEQFDAGWEAGAGKATEVLRLTWDANDVYDNRGPGLWCDVDCRDVTYSNNRSHGNRGPGLFFEISDTAHVFGNRVWENGWGFPAWGWGAGIVISSSSNAEVHDNVVAWNPDGISVISQNRPADPIGTMTDPNRWNNVHGNSVHDNVVCVAPQASDSGDKIMLGWLQDWSGVMYDAASNNRGSANRYWNSTNEPMWARFAWSAPADTLAGFNATPGEEGGTYLTMSERDAALTAAGVPVAPLSH